MPDIKIRLAYQAQGVEGYYQAQGAEYQNPHEEGILMMISMLLSAVQIHFPTIELSQFQFLDLCCGSGEATRGLLAHGVLLENIDASDPYTQQAYMSIYQKECLPWSFVDISQGCILNHHQALLAPSKADPSKADPSKADLSKAKQSVKPYHCIVCSFALHLCPIALLGHVLYQLSLCADYLLILTPHKKPDIEIDSGWLLIDELYLSEERVRGRLYIC